MSAISGHEKVLYVTRHRVSLRVRRNYADIDDIAKGTVFLRLTYIFCLFFYLLPLSYINMHLWKFRRTQNGSTRLLGLCSRSSNFSLVFLYLGTNNWS